MLAIELAYEQGILRQPDISILQRWALSYFLFDRKRIKAEDNNEYWKNFLMLTDRPTYDRIYNPELVESDLISVEDFETIEQGLSDPNEIEAILNKLSSQQTVSDASLAVNNGEWV